MVPFIWFPLSRVCHLHERAPERAWVRPRNLSLSREPFSYTYCKGLQVFPLVHGSFHVISTQQGASFAGARNHSFSKKLYSSSKRLFSFTFLAVVMHHMHERAWARNQPPPVKMKPSSETIYMSFARSEQASAQPTMIVCPIHVLTFVTDCWWLECVFYYGIL